MKVSVFQRWWIGSVVGLLIGIFATALLTDPPKLLMSTIDGFFSDQCQSGEIQGVRLGMSRREVLRSFGMLNSDSRSRWYVVDEALGLPPDAIEAPMWPAGRLPDRLMNADRWEVVRAGHATGFEVAISFENDRVVCADAEYEVPMF